MTVSLPARPRAIVLDIEGTTTPIDFVYRVLFPYARTHAAPFLARTWGSPDTASAVSLLSNEWRVEAAAVRARVPAGSQGFDRDAVHAYAILLMDDDRKSTGLKALQGLIWQEGFSAGDLRGQVYADVPPAFERWIARDISLFIYSSGSVLAQRLIFESTAAGDLTRFLSGYFDTEVGPKKEASSYATIAARTGIPSAEMLFISDVIAELDAARHSGMATLLCARDGEPPADSGHPTIRSFDDIPL